MVRIPAGAFLREHNAPRSVMEMAAEKAQFDTELLAACVDPETSWGEDVEIHLSKADTPAARAVCLWRAASSSGSAARPSPVGR